MSGQLAFNLESYHAAEACDFIGEHPDFWMRFCTFAHQMIRAGRDHYGAKAVVERVRWETAVKGGEDFKINNNFVSTFVREFMRQYPEHDGFFRTRC